MNRFISKKFLLSAALATGMTAPTPAQSYQIDCAILLCLAGGFPRGTECTAAKIELIRRITPFPIEPPLQIWRCPLSIAMIQGGRSTASEKLYKFAFLDENSLPSPEQAIKASMVDLAVEMSATNGTADVDISGPEFDFVRSLQVYDIDWRHSDYKNIEGDYICRISSSRVRRGTYGNQGSFSWAVVGNPDAIPSWVGFSTHRGRACDHSGGFRGVAVGWTDYSGKMGWEVVTY